MAFSFLTSKAIILVGILAVLHSTTGFAQKNADLEGNITISGAFALYPMAVKWAEEFKKEHPKVKIDISAGGAGKGMTDVLNKMVDIGMVSREVNTEEVKKGAFAIGVAKDAVVPTINAKNPKINDIKKKGIKKEQLANIFINGNCKTWGVAIGISSTIPIRVYTRADACGAAESWAKYFGKKQEDLLGVGVNGDPGVAQAIAKDALGIGYNNLAFAYNAKTKQPISGVLILPIDLNNNGVIDGDENFYNNLDQLIAAISAGKYPSPPVRDLYFVTSGKPTNKVVLEFIKYVLGKGQVYVQENGYVAFDKARLTKEVSKLK